MALYNALKTWLDAFSPFFFLVLPYVSVIMLLVITIQRYRERTFSYSSLSSQFLENKHHFWSSVPFHYGIILVLAGHAACFFLPRQVLAFNAAPVRLWALEVTGLALGIMTLVGLFNIVVRRITTSKVRRVTTIGDWILYGLLVVQVGTGVGTAVAHPWGSSWFASSAAPYLWSLVKLKPDLGYVATLPPMVKLHIVNAWLIIAFFPFTRLVHILVVPNPYLWRKTQVVRWNWDRKAIRNPEVRA